MERVLVIASPRNYFALLPRAELMDEYGAEARFTPNVGLWRLGIALFAGGSAYAAAFLPLFFTAGMFNAALWGLSLGGLVTVYMHGTGYWRHVYPHRADLQPLWCLFRVVDQWAWKPVYEEIVDNEGNVTQVLVDVEVTSSALAEPQLVALSPRALLLEARPSEPLDVDLQPKDKGIKRADYLYLGLRPTDLIEWFKRKSGQLGMPDVMIGGGYVVTALIAVFLFVRTQGPG